MNYINLIEKVNNLPFCDKFSSVDGWCGNDWIKYVISQEYKKEKEIIYKQDIENESLQILKDIQEDTILIRYWVTNITEDNNYK